MSERTPKERHNDRRLAELAPRIQGAGMDVFGVDHLSGVPKSVRHRAIEAMGGKTLEQQAWTAVRENDWARAKELFLQCLEHAGAQPEDPRFFSIYWGLGKIAVEEGSARQAADHFVHAITLFPAQSREEHYVTAVEQILAADPSAEVHAAALASQGLTQLLTAERPCLRLKEIQRRLEGRRTNEVRPAFPQSFLM